MIRSRALLMYGIFEPSDRHLETLRNLGCEPLTATTEEDAKALAPRSDFVFGHRFVRQVLPVASGLQWVQSTAGGVERLPLTAFRKRGICLTRCTAPSETIARHGIALAWAIQRRIPEALERQRSERWDNAFHWPAAPGTAFVFGLGPIGCCLAKILRREGLQVVGVNRSGQLAGRCATEFSEILPTTAGLARLGEADWCFLAMPGTRETMNLFDGAALERLPRDAVLVNLGQGDAIDLDALECLLSKGHLAGVGLDVVPAALKCEGSILWKLPRTIVTPHVASHHKERAELLERFVESQLLRRLEGAPLQNVVDLETACSLQS